MFLSCFLTSGVGRNPLKMCACCSRIPALNQVNVLRLVLMSCFHHSQSRLKLINSKKNALSYLILKRGCRLYPFPWSPNLDGNRADEGFWSVLIKTWSKYELAEQCFYHVIMSVAVFPQFFWHRNPIQQKCFHSFQQNVRTKQKRHLQIP